MKLPPLGNLYYQLTHLYHRSFPKKWTECSIPIISKYDAPLSNHSVIKSHSMLIGDPLLKQAYLYLSHNPDVAYCLI
jgi:hypothetical protein